MTCPVCAYPHLIRPPEAWNICPCCGTEFGVDDVLVTHAQLRSGWVNAGAPWFSRCRFPPVGWNPLRQLRAGGHAVQSIPGMRPGGRWREADEG